jgi:hypothetical protein
VWVGAGAAGGAGTRASSNKTAGTAPHSLCYLATSSAPVSCNQRLTRTKKPENRNMRLLMPPEAAAAKRCLWIDTIEKVAGMISARPAPSMKVAVGERGDRGDGV